MSELKITGTIGTGISIGGTVAGGIDIGGLVEKPQSVYEKDYERLINKPKINEIELIGDKSFNDLGLKPLTNIEIAKMINGEW